MNYIYKYKFKKSLKFRFNVDYFTLSRTNNITRRYRKAIRRRGYKIRWFTLRRRIFFLMRKRLFNFFNYLRISKEIRFEKILKKKQSFDEPFFGSELFKNYRKSKIINRKLRNKFNILLKWKVYKNFRWNYLKKASKRFNLKWRKKDIRSNWPVVKWMQEDFGFFKKFNFIKKPLNFPVISCIFPMNPKKKFKRFKRKPRSMSYKNMLYRGFFFSLRRFYLFYGGINVKLLNKKALRLKYNYNKYNLFNSFVNLRLFILLYHLSFFTTIKKAYIFIKVEGLCVNFKQVFSPNYVVKLHDLIFIKGLLKTKFLNVLFKQKFFFSRLLSVLSYFIVFNVRTLSFVLLNISTSFNLSLKNKVAVLRPKYIKKSNISFPNKYFFDIRYFKRRK